MDEAELKRPLFGIIGLGRFGSLVATLLRDQGRVVAADRRDIRDDAARLKIEAVGLPEAAAARNVILCPPISALRSVLRSIRPFLRPGALLADTCSVKLEPARILLAESPPTVGLLATHPLFGPDSAGAGLAGLKIVLCPLRRARPRQARRFLERLGLEVIVTTPEEHDRQIAETQAVVQWIGRALESLGAGPRPIDTTGHLRLLEILQYVSRDSWQLFQDMQRHNRYAAAARRRFLDALRDVESKIMDGWQIVYRAAGMPEAEIVKGYLESEEIPVDLDYESAGKVYGLTMDGLGEVRIRVPDEYAEAARKAIAEKLGPRGEPQGGGDPDAA